MTQNKDNVNADKIGSDLALQELHKAGVALGEGLSFNSFPLGICRNNTTIAIVEVHYRILMYSYACTIALHGDVSMSSQALWGCYVSIWTQSKWESCRIKLQGPLYVTASFSVFQHNCSCFVQCVFIKFHSLYMYLCTRSQTQSLS